MPARVRLWSSLVPLAYYKKAGEQIKNSCFSVVIQIGSLTRRISLLFHCFYYELPATFWLMIFQLIIVNYSQSVFLIHLLTLMLIYTRYLEYICLLAPLYLFHYSIIFFHFMSEYNSKNNPYYDLYNYFLLFIIVINDVRH